MTPIVFKIRFTDSRTNRRSTPQRNAKHVQYIGEREHALIAEKDESHVKYIGERFHAALTAKKNGLFGKIRGEYTNSYDRLSQYSNNVFGRGDLSKEAIMDLIYKLGLSQERDY